MSASNTRARASSVAAASGMSALSPLPRAGFLSIRVALCLCLVSCAFRVGALRGLLPLAELFRQRRVRLGAARFRVVAQDGQPVARRFGEAHVARNHGAVDLLLEELAHVAGH